MGKPEGKRLLGRPRHRWKDNIKMDLREVGCDLGECIDLAEDMDQWRVPLISTIKETAITSELIQIYRCNQLLQRLKTGIFFLPYVP